MKKKIIFTIMFVFLMIVITFLLFNHFKTDNNNKLTKVKVAEPTLT